MVRNRGSGAYARSSRRGANLFAAGCVRGETQKRRTVPLSAGGGPGQEDGADLVEGGGLGRGLVVAVALDAREAQGHAAGVLGARLNAGGGELDGPLGTDGVGVG